jgi:hypothetical protein
LILQYSTLVAQFAETYLKNDGSGRNTLNSNDFKIPAFYQAWCDNTQGNDQISNWLNSLMAALGGTDKKFLSQRNNIAGRYCSVGLSP